MPLHPSSHYFVAAELLGCYSFYSLPFLPQERYLSTTLHYKAVPSIKKSKLGFGADNSIATIYLSPIDSGFNTLSSTLCAAPTPPK